MIETITALVTWKTLGAAVALAVALWKTRQVRKAVKELRDVYVVVREARADRQFSKAEVEEIIREVVEAVQAVAPLLVKLVKRYV